MVSVKCSDSLMPAVAEGMHRPKKAWRDNELWPRGERRVDGEAMKIGHLRKRANIFLIAAAMRGKVNRRP